MDPTDPPNFHRVETPGSRVFYLHKSTMRRLYSPAQVAKYLGEANIAGVDVKGSGLNDRVTNILNNY